MYAVFRQNHLSGIHNRKVQQVSQQVHMLCQPEELTPLINALSKFITEAGHLTAKTNLDNASFPYLLMCKLTQHLLNNDDAANKQNLQHPNANRAVFLTSLQDWCSNVQTTIKAKHEEEISQLEASAPSVD